MLMKLIIILKIISIMTKSSDERYEAEEKRNSI